MHEEVRGELELDVANRVGPRITLKSSGLVAHTFTTEPHHWPWPINSAFSFIPRGREYGNRVACCRAMGVMLSYLGDL